GRHEFGAEDHRVETALEQADHVRAGVALQAAGFGVNAAKLLFGNVAVIAAQFLLGLELHAVVGELALAALAVLAGAILAAIDGALRAAPDVLAHAAVEFVLGFIALGHRVLLIKQGEEPRPPLSRISRNRQVLRPKRKELRKTNKTAGRETPRGA